ncbi:hypothetical protein GH5_06243 [Leishmania sp. Ghana 2012 LV757]|uniref:hypothetical protein n=1 Tax=Leishmania sp. Ghana 2012 LV757 TaxID=2803181 RepID=UPI001B50C1C4|nr:hypothetical protein GH5_06243 [Leishmania sp. Ghana 2012 LV757]
MRELVAVTTKDSVAIDLRQYLCQWTAMATGNSLEDTSEDDGDDDAVRIHSIIEEAVIVAHPVEEVPLLTALPAALPDSKSV